jgi:hypothetical protein
LAPKARTNDSQCVPAVVALTFAHERQRGPGVGQQYPFSASHRVPGLLGLAQTFKGLLSVRRRHLVSSPGRGRTTVTVSFCCLLQLESVSRCAGTRRPWSTSEIPWCSQSVWTNNGITRMRSGHRRSQDKRLDLRPELRLSSAFLKRAKLSELIRVHPEGDAGSARWSRFCSAAGADPDPLSRRPRWRRIRIRARVVAAQTTPASCLAPARD